MAIHPSDALSGLLCTAQAVVRSALRLMVLTLMLSALVCLDPIPKTASTHSPDLERLLAQAKEAEKNQRYVEAEALYRSFLKTHPNEPEILQRLGLDYYLSSQFKEAIPPLSRALMLDPSRWGSALFLGISYYRVGRFREAIEPLRHALALEPELDEANFWMGSALLATGQTESAIGYLLRVSNSSEARARADALLVKAYRKAAEEAYQRIAKLNPDSYRVHQLRAENLTWRNLTNRALLEYEEAMKRKPGLEGIHRAMGELYWQQKQFDLAAKEYEAELRLNPLDDQANLRLGEFWLAMGNSTRAVTCLQSALAVHTEAAAEAYHFLGEAELARKDLSEAEAALKHAAEDNPQEPSNHSLLIEVYRQMGKPDLAEKEGGVLRSLSRQAADRR